MLVFRSSDAECKDTMHVGGKASSLAVLTHIVSPDGNGEHVQVPPFFAVSTTAFQQHATSCASQIGIFRLLFSLKSIHESSYPSKTRETF
jgi:phosphoenolpyruvate synthase/pyruvate phosphate dikinase